MGQDLPVHPDIVEPALAQGFVGQIAGHQHDALMGAPEVVTCFLFALKGAEGEVMCVEVRLGRWQPGMRVQEMHGFRRDSKGFFCLAQG